MCDCGDRRGYIGDEYIVVVGRGSSRYVFVGHWVDINWWSSSTVLLNVLPFALYICALGDVGCMERVDL